MRVRSWAACRRVYIRGVKPTIRQCAAQSSIRPFKTTQPVAEVFWAVRFGRQGRTQVATASIPALEVMNIGVTVMYVLDHANVAAFCGFRAMKIIIPS